MDGSEAVEYLQATRQSAYIEYAARLNLRAEQMARKAIKTRRDIEALESKGKEIPPATINAYHDYSRNAKNIYLAQRYLEVELPGTDESGFFSQEGVSLDRTKKQYEGQNVNELNVENRDNTQKNNVLRKTGKMPAIFYGKKEKSTPIIISKSEFKKIWKEAGESSVIDLVGKNIEAEALIYDVDLDPITDEPRHVDFYVF